MDIKDLNKNNKPSTGASIPRSGFVSKFDHYVERVVGSRNYSNFILQRSLFVIFKSMPTIFGSFLRGIVYRQVLGELGKGCLIEKNVTLDVPMRIYLGHRVVLGESSVIDPKGYYGKIIIKNDVHIQRWCRITAGGARDLPGTLIIEDSVYIGPYTYIHAAGSIKIGKNCLFGPRITVIAGNHNYRKKAVLIRFQGGTAKDILIDEDVWLSANVTVLGGCRIGKGAVIGAGSVVIDDIPPYSIAVGTPAKIIGSRE